MMSYRPPLAEVPGSVMVYSYSLGIALAVLFIISFALPWWASVAAANDEALHHGGEVQSLASYLMDFDLWFESKLAVGVHVDRGSGRFVDFLRHKGSPESKPAGAANSETGAYSRWPSLLYASGFKR
jgi:hypothetical protein